MNRKLKHRKRYSTRKLLLRSFSFLFSLVLVLSALPCECHATSGTDNRSSSSSDLPPCHSNHNEEPTPEHNQGDCSCCIVHCSGITVTPKDIDNSLKLKLESTSKFDFANASVQATLNPFLEKTGFNDTGPPGTNLALPTSATLCIRYQRWLI